MTGAQQMACAARALKRRYGTLLAPEPSFHRPELDEISDRLEAARLRATDDVGADQMQLDLSERAHA